ncbi:MAG: hypothetical protein HQ450_12850, partial [Alcaligenaceae bacterium]|nr:hypothetical protein [Alcaligenaceae bacterium]
MSQTRRSFYLFLLTVVSLNTLLWLDSFDRYLSSRYHVMLSAILPDEVFVISRDTQALLARAQQALRTAPVGAASPVQQAQGSPQITLTATPVAPEPVAPAPVSPAPVAHAPLAH